MKKQVKYFFIIISSVLFFSCQRELNFENSQVSAGSLKSNINNDCLPKKVAGTYIEGRYLADTNYIQVDVNVTSQGRYLIKTDTVNGYQFEGTGTFSTTGPNSIKLTGKGKPFTTGNNNFIVTYNNSSCFIQVNVAPAMGIIASAVFALQGAPGNCIPATISGNYIKNHFLTSEDTVSIVVKVTIPGSYNLSTNTVNGYSFLAAGVISDTGLQKISMTATGAPLKEGTDIFTVIGAASCTFPVTVTKAIGVSSNDYFPLTRNSYWTYDNQLHIGDTIKRIMTDTVITNNVYYRIMEEYDMFGGNIHSYFRKAGNDYFEYGSLDKYTASFSYLPQLFGELPFLKENMVTGDSWKTDEFMGTFSSGQIIFLQYNFYCLDANAAITLNGNSFINVYKIRILPQVRSQFAPLGSTGEIIDMYYAKGVGLIYIKGTKNGLKTIEMQIRNWMVY